MIVDAIRRLPVDRIVLDGEAVCPRPNDHPDFLSAPGLAKLAAKPA